MQRAANGRVNKKRELSSEEQKPNIEQQTANIQKRAAKKELQGGCFH